VGAVGIGVAVLPLSRGYGSSDASRDYISIDSLAPLS
jgi:hypothetical protein